MFSMSENSEDPIPSWKSQTGESFEEGPPGLASANFEERNSSEDETQLVIKKTKRMTNFSDSESDEKKDTKDLKDHFTGPSNSEDIVTKKSRIKHFDTSESENSSHEDIISQKKSVRNENKIKNLKNKFKNLISHTKNLTEVRTAYDEQATISDGDKNVNSDEEMSCFKIKQKIKKSAYPINSICDPDTSDEERNPEQVRKQKSKHSSPRSTKLTSPKPIRMSAKQAMENMHKIKSESNRMLREKEVSLPYHRPKALSLKDIMNRRKPAIAPDGKALPIKMNNEQLKQYVLLLEQRQKEVIELCKSDTEEEEEDEKENIENVKKNITPDITISDITEPYVEVTNTGQDIKQDVNISNNEKISIESDLQKKILLSNIENQTSIEKESINICANMEVDGDCKETDLNNANNISLSETEQNNDITLEEQKNNILVEINGNKSVEVSAKNTEQDSQKMVLLYDSEKLDLAKKGEQNICEEKNFEVSPNIITKQQNKTPLSDDDDDDEFLDNDFNYDEIDKLIKNTDITNDSNGVQNFLLKPKLNGAPGMVIDLDNTNSVDTKQQSGVDILKQRFTYFATLKSLEDMDKDREKKFKPGLQHLKLKKELEDLIAEQRSLEWEKRLEEEKRLKSEVIEHFEDNDIEKLEAKLEECNQNLDEEKVVTESSESEEEPIENDIILEDKPKKRNPMVDDEAEESECEDGAGEQDVEANNGEADDGEEADLEDDDDDDETSDSSSESEEERESKPRKGRILKAFQDSDEESSVVEDLIDKEDDTNKTLKSEVTQNIDNLIESKKLLDDEHSKESLDDELQLAQANKSSEDLFNTHESDRLSLDVAALSKNSDNISADLGTQTFSILDSLGARNQALDLNSQENTSVCRTLSIGDDINLLVGVCSNIPQTPISTENGPSHMSQTQEMGDDVLALCTEKFYDNPFVSLDKATNCNSPLKLIDSSQSQEFGESAIALCTGKFYDNPFITQQEDTEALKTTQNLRVITDNDNNILNPPETRGELNSKNIETTVLNSILEELDGPDFEKPKNKFFANNNTQHIKTNLGYSQAKKKLVIESDDETNDGASPKKIKKLKKKKAKERALQISDDEEEEEDMEAPSDIESEMNDENEERIVEYDSEENEVEVKKKTTKKKQIGAFFENEAELTSEDEWVGSGDEDERGLDRMEREEGDDETFHQGQLQRELGQIHMREVLDQDKREVRIIQELLFEDGDLGDGHRQRKFRWRNADGEEEMGTNPNEFLDTQEDEFESEEQWRKERHEREMFLRKLQENDNEDVELGLTRTASIKANLCSRGMPNEAEKDVTTAIAKKAARDIPSPKKSFTIFQQNYHGSLLTRGRGALARLAALATPLATDDDDAPKLVTTANRRNFVFTALSQDENPKVTKRKADPNVNTPRLIKKMKTESSNKHYKSTLFDHLNS